MKNDLKKYVAVATLIITLFISGNVSAQYYQYEKNIRMGLVFNPSMSWLKYNNDIADVTSKFGYAYGLIADFGFARNYYFSTGLTINSINSNMNNHNAPENSDPNLLVQPVDRDISLKYAEVPLTIKLKSDGQDYGRFYGQFGFTAGVRVSGKEQPLGGAKRNINGADLFRLGLQIGTGVEWNLGGNLGLQTGLSYNNGFTRAINEVGSPKNSFVALNLGLLF